MGRVKKQVQSLPFAEQKVKDVFLAIQRLFSKCKTFQSEI